VTHIDETGAAGGAVKFHPLADLFPPMKGEEFDALVADIKVNGLREKIDLYQGKILDGRTRYRALLRLGIDPSADQGRYFRNAIYAHSVGGEVKPHEQSNDDRVRAYVISKNIHRRHLTAEQKREIIATLIKAAPEKSDRQIAETLKTSHQTVGRVRKTQEATGPDGPVEKRVGKDGKTRKTPKPKPEPADTNKRDGGNARTPEDEREFEATIAPPVILEAKRKLEIENLALKSEIEELKVERDKLREQLRAAEIKIAGPESEVEELKAENAKLRRQLEMVKPPGRCGWAKDDGGRRVHGYGGPDNDCVPRAVAIATGKPYPEVLDALTAETARYVKRWPRSRVTGWIKRSRDGVGYRYDKIYGRYLKSIGWQYTPAKARIHLRADELPPGRLVVLVHRHAVAVIDGTIHDTYDSGMAGRRPVVGYWSQAAADPAPESLIEEGQAIPCPQLPQISRPTANRSSKPMTRRPSGESLTPT
jgi:hypothetical protein